jgi:hypothetical protein
MRTKLLVASLTLPALAVLGCGASGASSPPAAPPGANLGVPSHIYRVKLSGSREKPPGPGTAVGYAVIALHDSHHELCWRFAHLHGFTDATDAHIRVGPSVSTGHVFLTVSAGPRLHHRGCLSVTTNAMSKIEVNPSGYYVDVASVRYPNGVIRAQL